MVNVFMWCKNPDSRDMISIQTNQKGNDLPTINQLIRKERKKQVKKSKLDFWFQ